MEIEQLPTADLIPYARNTRTHSSEQVAQIAGSIREFGFTNPILIDAENGIIAGHGRVMAASKLGLVKVPCIRLAHLTDTQKRAYIIADNKLALNAGWDEEMLDLELGELKAEDFEMELTGFSKQELAEIMSREDKFEVKSDTQRATGRGPYHVKDVCIGAFAVVSSSGTSDHKEIIKMKASNPTAFSRRIIMDFSEMLSRPGPAWPQFDLVTIPATHKKDHPMIDVGKEIAAKIGSKFETIFAMSERKSKGIHAQEKPQVLSRIVKKTNILLIDDIITTGRTLRNCVDQIHKEGGHCRPFAWITYQ